MLRLTATTLAPAKRQHIAIMGADIPSFRNFPYKANDILHLYRDFWRLILRYPENERHDLIFRLRNEFRSKKSIGRPKLIAKAVQRGRALLDMYKSKIEYSESKLDRRAVQSASNRQLRAEQATLASLLAAEGQSLNPSSSSTHLSSSSAAATAAPALSAKQRMRNSILGIDDETGFSVTNDSTTPVRRPLSGQTAIPSGGTTCVNTLWEQIQQSTHSTIPGLRHHKHSRELEGQRLSKTDNYSFVPSK